MKINYVKLYGKLFHFYNNFFYRFLDGYALPPAQFLIAATYDCNIDCTFCFEGRKDMLAEPELSFKEMKKVIDQVPFYGLLTYVGGEPFMRPDIREIIEYSFKKCKFTIVTNGTYNIEKNARLIVEKGIKSVFHKGLVEIAVSLSGDKKFHDETVQMKGAFDKSFEGVKRICRIRSEMGKRFPLISFRIPILKENVSHLHELVALARDLDIDFCIFMLHNTQEGTYNPTPIQNYQSKFYKRPKSAGYIPEEVLRREFALIREICENSKLLVKYTPHGITEEEIIKYYSPQADLKNFTCRNPWQKVMIAPNGDVLPCVMVKEGNIKKDSILSIWNRKILRSFRRDLKENKLYPICFGCCGLTYMPNAGIESPSAPTTSPGAVKAEISHSPSL